jgi:catechol 2,3-dioxygenase-like lactoylglutathione lyase family enzyme
VAAENGSMLRTINALTLGTCDMSLSCAFYDKLGLIRTFETPAFVTFSAESLVNPGNNRLHVNLQLEERFRASAPGKSLGWGRAIIFVSDVDALHAKLAARGVVAPAPRDAPWGERYFHVLDPMVCAHRPGAKPLHSAAVFNRIQKTN